MLRCLLLPSVGPFFSRCQPLRAASATLARAHRRSASAAALRDVSSSQQEPLLSHDAILEEPTSQFWSWQHEGRVVRCHYEVAGDEGPKACKASLLFLPGFGAGTFHFRRQLEQLPSAGLRVYSLDFVGQGKSWPDAGDEAGLVLSTELYAAQAAAFIEQVVCEPVFIAGNSLGGLVAALCAAVHPELVRGLILLNAAPFWTFIPNPRRSPTASRIISAALPWAGRLPAPRIVRSVVRLLFDRLRSPETVRTLLRQAYVDERRVNDSLVRSILLPTQRPAALDAFASIFLSPCAHLSFDEMLAQRTCPVCLIYGADDQWVKRSWGQRALQIVPDAVLYELSPCAHCPQDECPQAVNELVAAFVRSRIEPDVLEILPQPGSTWLAPGEGDGTVVVKRVGLS